MSEFCIEHTVVLLYNIITEKLHKEKNMKHGIVCRETNGMFRYLGWPTVAKDENGVLYAVCSGHRLSHICPFGKNYMFKSYDEGETWSMPIIINDTVLDDRDAGICPLGNGKLLMTYFNHTRDFYIDGAEKFVSFWRDEKSALMQKNLYMGAIDYLKNMPESYNRYGSFIRISEDGGNRFGEAIKVPVSSPHGPVKLADGRLLYLGKERGAGMEDKVGHILAYDSTDDGKSWNFLYDLEFPDGCVAKNVHEPYAIELPDGTIIGAIRAQGDPVAYNFTIYLTYSYDGGKTWTKPMETGICGSPPHLLRHSSGAVILSYARRHAPMGECVRISYDNGKTFGEERIIDPAYVEDIGYPSSVELSDGKILTVYYQRYADDPYCSVLYTIWEL